MSPAADKPGVSVTRPFNRERATAGNGVMVALLMDSQAQVDAFYNKAIELGAMCEGKSGLRGEIPGFYAGYFRDLDGNKFNAFHSRCSGNSSNKKAASNAALNVV